MVAAGVRQAWRRRRRAGGGGRLVDGGGAPATAPRRATLGRTFTTRRCCAKPTHRAPAHLPTK